MLGGIRTTIVNFAQMIADIGWAGAEGIQL